MVASLNNLVLSVCRNPSYWGKLCFLSTPEGENCGLVKNLSVTAIVSSKMAEPMLDKLISCGMEKLADVSLSSINTTDKVFLNGVWIGVCQDSSSFVMNLRQLRRKKLIHSQVPFISSFVPELICFLCTFPCFHSLSLWYMMDGFFFNNYYLSES